MGNFLFPDRLLNYPRSTYYSKEIVDFKALPTTDGYPKFVKEPTFKIWNSMARYGSIVEVTLDTNHNSFTTTYTHLTDDNVVEIADKEIYYYNSIKMYGRILKLPFYPQILFVLRVTRSIVYRFKRLLSI